MVLGLEILIKQQSLAFMTRIRECRMRKVFSILIVGVFLLTSIFGSIAIYNSKPMENSPQEHFNYQPQVSGYYLYIVTFQENGLPPGTNWAVQFGSSYSSGTGSSIVFTSAAGVFNYFIYYGNQSSYAMDGTANIQGNTVITVNLYHLSIDLQGNNDNFTWYAIIHDSTSLTCDKQSNGSSVEFFVPTGYYSYSVIINEFGQNVTIYTNGTEISSDIQASILLRSIIFHERGMPMTSGDLTWSAELTYYVVPEASNSVPHSIIARTNSPSFTVFYPYSVFFPSYIISVQNDNSSFQVSMGNIDLSRTSESVNLYFNNISIKARNISNGTEWGLVAFNGTYKVFGFKTTDSSSNLYLLNGTYNYSEYLYSNYSDGSPTYSSSGSNVFNVPSSPTCLLANFSSVVNLHVEETGLTLANNWEAQVSGQNTSFVLSGDSETLDAPVASGTYFINFTSGSTSMLKGTSYDINASDNKVSVSFYRLSFDQTGLSQFNAIWSIQLFQTGQPGSIATDYLGKSTDIVFLVVNGTYSFQLYVYFTPSIIWDKPSFNYSDTASSPDVSGSNLTDNITFFPKPGLYIVHFEILFNGPGELNLLVYNQYISRHIDIDFSASNSTQTVNCLFENQTIAVTCESDGYSNTTYFSTNDNNINVSLNLSWLQYRTVVFSESGLSSGTLWKVSANGVVHASNNSRIYFTFSSVSVSFTVNDSGLYYPSPGSGQIELSPSTQEITISFMSFSGISLGYVSRTIDSGNAHVYNDLFQNYPEQSFGGFFLPDFMHYTYSSFTNLIVSSSKASNVYFLDRATDDPYGSLYRYSSGSGSLITMTNPAIYYSVPEYYGGIHLIGLSSNGSYLYVTAGNRLFIESTTSLEPVGCHVIGPSGFIISSMIIDRYSSKLYAVDSNTGGVEVVGFNGSNLAYFTLSNLSGFQTGFPVYFICNPDSGSVMIHYGKSSFVYLNTEYNILGGTFAVDYCPVAATFITNLDQIAVVGYSVGQNGTFEFRLSLINAGNLNFVANASLSAFPSGIIFDPQDKMLYVSEIGLLTENQYNPVYYFTAGDIAVIDPSSISHAVSNISVGYVPMGLSETVNGSTILVENYNSGNLVIINVNFGSTSSASYLSQNVVAGIIIAASLVAGTAVGYIWLYRRPRSSRNI
jgi:hypothetical protein